MPLSGPVVHRQLMGAHAETQSRLQHAQLQISQGQTRRESLEDAREDSMLGLAEHYLPKLTPDAVRTPWVEIRPSLVEILRRKQQHGDRLHAELDAAIEVRRAADDQIVEVNERLDGARDAVQVAIERVEKKLRDDPNFVSLADRAAVAEAALERAEDNLEEIDQDSARKLPAYENCELFTYLRDRRFGTSSYKERGLTRRMDRWLAKFIDFNQAIGSYRFLKETPESMRKVIADDRAALVTVMTELERMRDTAAEEIGLPEKTATCDAIEAEREDLLEAVKRHDQSAARVRQELAELEDTRCSYYREAIDIFRGMLARCDARELRDQARRTPSPSDDQIVARLSGIDQDLEELEDLVDGRRRRIRDQQSVLAATARLIQRFRSAGFDAARCRFDDSLDVLGRLADADDEDDVDDVWSDIRRAQNWGPSTMDKITEVATHPMTQVLVNAMASAAGAALSEHARRAGHRRRSHSTPRGGHRWGGSGDLFGRRR